MHENYESAATLKEKKDIVIAQAKKSYGSESSMVRALEYLWDILNASTDYPKLLDFYWSDLQFIAPETLPGSLNIQLLKFFNRINNNSYVIDLLWQNGYIRRAGRNAIAVREFTEGVRGNQPDRPSLPLSRDKVEFIVSMVCSEMVELLQTVMNPDENPISVIKTLCDKDYNKNYVKPASDNTVSIIAEQADAMVDAMYYMYDTATRMGVNLDKVFNVVQEANMAKRGPNGKFIIRPSDNKIIKPDDWREPNIREEIERQIKDGGWK